MLNFIQPQTRNFNYINVLPYLNITTSAIMWIQENGTFELNGTYNGGDAEITDIIFTDNSPVVLVGDHLKKADAAKLCDKIGPSKLINLVGKTSLLEVVAVLKAAAAGVGPDSGPGHLSAAVGTPYVTLFGPTSPKRAAPYGCEHLVVQSELSCISCYKKRCPDLDRQCMQLVTVETVKAKLLEALKRNDFPGGA